MAYLAVKKVKGRHYGYVQESYREGGTVRTRTLEYLGAIDPTVARQVSETRRQLGQADMASLVQSVREATGKAAKPSEAHTAPETGQTFPAPPSAPVKPSEPPQRIQRMKVNNRTQLVDTKTGELIEPTPDKPVITTGNETQPVRPFQQSLKLPAKLDEYGVGLTAIRATHARYGRDLKAHRINPAAMPDVKIAYGHPDSLKRNRDGSYTVTVSRRTQNKRHQVNKSKMWQHYRQALASATMDAIATDRPELHHQLQTALDDSHKETTRQLISALKHTSSPVQRLGLSLQLTVWNRIPKALRQKGVAQDFGQASFDTTGDWRKEAAHVIAEARRLKGGWGELETKTKASQRKLKSAITSRRNKLDDMTKLQSLSARLSGKRRKIIREIMVAEAKLKATDELAKRAAILKGAFNV